NVLGTGPLIFNGGSLIPQNATRTLTNPVTISANSGLTFFSSTDTFGITLNGNVTLNGTRTLTDSMKGNLTFSGVMAEGTTGAGITYSGLGNVTVDNVRLDGVNTYTGTTTVLQGIVNPSQNSNSGAAGAFGN